MELREDGDEPLGVGGAARQQVGLMTAAISLPNARSLCPTHRGYASRRIEVAWDQVLARNCITHVLAQK
jgi:hypothetical protein